MNPMTTATEQACIYGKIETIGRKEIGHRPALRNCLAAIAEKMMNGFAKVATTVECPPSALGFAGQGVNGDDAWLFQ
jgi:hypothetical protein